MHFHLIVKSQRTA